MARVTQPVLPLLPADATPIGPIAGLVEDREQGGVVFVSGLATFSFTPGDELSRRLAAVQLVATKIARASEVAAAFGVTRDTLWRWRRSLEVGGAAGLVPDKRGPKGPWKLTDEVVARIVELDARGWTLAAIGDEVGVSATTVQVALGRRPGSAGWEARKAAASAEETDAETADTDTDTDADVDADRPEFIEVGGGAELGDAADGGVAGCGVGLPVLPRPVPRGAERALARYGLLEEAVPVFTPGAHLPLAGLLLALPALSVTGLLGVFDRTYGQLRNGFYGLRQVVLTMVFLAMLRDPRAEGLTRISPTDLGRMLGLDRAPEVKTLRRKLTELAAYRRGADLQRELATAHANARPDALGFLLIDGHLRAYFGTRDLPKTHVARLHMAARATAETWVADTDGDPVMVVTGEPSASLSAEVVRLLPDLRQVVGPDRRVTLIFDRGGWSPAAFKKIIDAGFDLIAYRKGDFDPLPAEQFSETTFTDPTTAAEYTYTLAETVVTFTLRKKKGHKTKDTVSLRQIHKQAGDGTQIPLVTTRKDLPAAEVCWRLAGRWRQENFFRYQRQHFALDALDSYADVADDADRLVPNPAKADATNQVTAAKHHLVEAKTQVAAAIDTATEKARRPGKTGPVEVERGAITAVATAQARLDKAQAARATTPTRVPLSTVRSRARLLDDERKLITHAVRMAAYNAESTLARTLRPYYARAEDEARALLREAMTLSGDLEVRADTLHVRLDPASAPRRSRALNALCRELTTTETTYPGTDLKIHYTVKDAPDAE